jgi:HK97 family phage major capsid protein
MTDYIKTQLDERVRAFESAKEIIDRAQGENRSLDATEQESVNRAMEDMDRRKAIVDDMRALAARESEVRAAVADHAEARPAVEVAQPVSNDADTIRSLARGEVRSATFEKRDVLKSSTGAPVATSFYDQVILLARATGPMLALGTELATAGGENLQIPRLSTYSVGSVNSEAATFGESDPAFSAFITLSAYKYGFLTQVSRELLEDSGVDVLSLLATNCGNALGFAVNTALTTGTGTAEPTGIVTAAGSGITGGTGTSGAFTYANLVNLAYSTDAAARALPGFGFMAKGSSIAAMRLLQDGAGQFVFQPSMSESTPDRVLGYPLYENPAMAAAATSAKSVIAGHFPSYYVRTVGGIRLDRSDDFAFSSDLVTFRCSYRVDGNLPQTSHVKYFIGGAS